MLPYYHYTIHLELSQQKQISSFLNATIRGGFGYTLRSMVCMMSVHTDCSGCMFKHTCVYYSIFETPPPPNAQRLSKYQHVPHLFILHAIQKQSIVTISLTLFGKTEHYLPYFIGALNKLGYRGLGENHILFRIVSIFDHCGNQIYDPSTLRIQSNTKANIVPFEHTLNQHCDVSIQFITPLVYRHNGKIINTFEMYPFITTLLRRYTTLAVFYGEFDQETFNPAPYLEQIDCLQYEVSSTPVKKERYSTRQRRVIDYSGVLGTVMLYSVNPYIFQLLKAGEIIHVGKNTAFGYGKYEISKPKPSIQTNSR